MKSSSLSIGLLAAALFASTALPLLPVQAADPAPALRQEARPLARTFIAKTPDGLSIAVQEWGNPNGPVIVFIHGLSQSRLSWSKQANSDLAHDFRLIAYDLRGHGSSDKPLTPDSYRHSKAWADELSAVLDAAQVQRAVLVGWSYGGLILSDYLKTYGSDRLAGALYLDSMIKMEAPRPPANQALAQMASDDLATNIAGTTAFLHTCFEKQPTPDEFKTMLAFNMLTPPEVRRAMVDRVIDYDAAARDFRLPVLVMHGAKDIPIPLVAAQHTAATIPGARLIVFEEAGHSPFFEEASRFNRELASFIRQVYTIKPNTP